MDSLLVNTSIIFIVGVNNPSLFTSNYLVDKGVIPRDAQIEGAVTLPVVSQIMYNRGHRFEAIEGRVSLNKDFPDVDSDSSAAFSDAPELELTDDMERAAAILTSLVEPFQLESVGINFRVFVASSDLERFTTSLPKYAKAVGMQFSVPIDYFQANYTLNAVTTSGTESRPAVNGLLIDINFDGQIQDKSSVSMRTEQIKVLVSRRQEFFETMKGTLGELGL